MGAVGASWMPAWRMILRSGEVVEGTRPRLFNSLGREMQQLAPASSGHVGIYSCGMTVYGDPHLGNLRPYVFADTLRRMLEFKGVTVTSVVNITDVGHAVGDGDLGEDKVEVTARAQNQSVWDVTKKYTEAFFTDLSNLNVLPHSHNPRASEYVPQMIEFAQVLERKGYTYQLDSGLYFDTSRMPDYGRLALRRPGSADTDVHRLEAVAGKRSPADFAVWRAERGEQKRLVHWESPWGPGVPGWHLECSVMSMSLLGDHFDIHTGGVDHREIHHVNEIAQSEAYLGDGRDWVPMWLHNEFVLLGSNKIAKSSGRVPILRDLMNAGHHPMVYRYFLLNAHYRSQLDFTEAGLRSAAAGYRRLLGRVAQLGPLPEAAGLDVVRGRLRSAEALAALAAIDDAITEDLNTPKVIAELNAVLRLDSLEDGEAALLASAAERLLGLKLGVLSADEVSTATNIAMPPDYIEGLIAARATARAGGDWGEADRIRNQLTEIGVRLVDTPQGTRWEPMPIDD
ncbi:cysteine--tRNA ligase [Actinoplanes sp. KI2]|uniref:cysteine--tRNA ligase n=1 Tax=Actinoplanes sp. KI2 TaxID=2983315 RepID=UPI0021D5AC7B|nr:cysteine--tRNA ligase [Actinoplanes sp. KI2]MCU7725974.1 cysteine--tRNA ligase [Actinoplanes sp. KI2]